MEEDVQGLLTHIPPGYLAQMASRLDLLTTGCVPWTTEGFRWACACLLDPMAGAMPPFPPADMRSLSAAPWLHPVRIRLPALRATAEHPRLAPVLVDRYGIDAGAAHFYRFLAIAEFVRLAFFSLSGARLLTMVQETLIFDAGFVESLVKMPYPVPGGTPPFALEGVLEDMRLRGEERARLQALPDTERLDFLVARDHRRGVDLLNANLAWDLPGYDAAMAYLDDVQDHPERYSWYLRPAAAIDPGLVPEWAVLEAYLAHRYGPEVGMAHSLRLAALTEFLDVHRGRLVQEGLGAPVASGDLEWNRVLLDVLLTMPVAVRETGRPALELSDVLRILTQRRRER